METLTKRKTGTQELLELLRNPYQAQIAQTSVIASLGTSIGFSALLAIGFSLLRPYNSVVYAPKLKLADENQSLPPLGRGLFSWVIPVWQTSENDLVHTIGLDAVVFLRTLAMCRNIFVTIAIVGCGILIPINLVKGTDDKVKFIVKVTPINTFGQANWGMAISAWLFNAIIIGFLWWNYRAVLKLRRQYYDSPSYHASLHARTLMLNDIPKDYRSDEGINRLIDAVVPTSSFSRTAIARNVKELPELIEDHQETVRELEKHLAQYLKDPKNRPIHRPQCYPSKKDPACDTYGKNQKVDAIEYLTSRIKNLEVEIRELRLTIDNRNPLPYGFASYDSIEECHGIAFAAKKRHPHGTSIVLAPRPNDIIWKNMPLSKAQRRTRRIINNMWVTLLTILWAAPNALISIFFTSLTNLGQVWEAFRDSLAAHTTWWAIVQGVASPAITSLVYLVLPIIFRRLSIKAGDRTKTARERHVAGKLYTFFVFNFLIGFSLFSTIWNFVSTIISATNSGHDAWRAILNADIFMATFISLCEVSPFWITWLLQRNLGAAIDLMQLWNLTWNTFLRKFSHPTPREMIELTAPQDFDYASYYNYFLFYSTVALCFAFIQPLVLPACALYFVLDFFLKKYLLLYIFVTKTESGGMFWRMFYNRMVFAVILSNLIAFLALWVHGDGEHTEAYTILPLPLLMIGFKLICKSTFDDEIHYYISSGELQDSETRRSTFFDGTKKDRLATRFGHPALYRPLMTPMVHAKAQNILASVYGGRLTDGNNNSASIEASSISGYSDTYVMNKISKTHPSGKMPLPGFELVPENRLDFAYYKGRHEFSGDYGRMSGIYSKPEDLQPPYTPNLHETETQPSTPTIPRNYVTRSSIASSDGNIMMGSDFHAHLNERQDERIGLVHGAATSPISAPRGHLQSHSVSLEPKSATSPRGGYGGVPQEEIQDPMDYDYFRWRRQDQR
ncbi:unnamed protein product [Blumeria hordei]|uniref:DUF221-domain-containing protein n=2 Tax=Blumeria hordei TaxID=2867405 RepID=A0A383UZ58_BLUHO|nr:DUF221 domain protein [Blumeria hordei DH14]SZF04670.1 unnamed protein product [Blumeria hordei]